MATEAQKGGFLILGSGCTKLSQDTCIAGSLKRYLTIKVSNIRIILICEKKAIIRSLDG
jgi:hypothetical protein